MTPEQIQTFRQDCEQEFSMIRISGTFWKEELIDLVIKIQLHMFDKALIYCALESSDQRTVIVNRDIIAQLIEQYQDNPPVAVDGKEVVADVFKHLMPEQ